MSLKYVVLTLINKQPQSGYDIVKSFDQSVGYFWSASHQQVYRELASLSESDWINFKVQTQSDKPDKKIYRISTVGRTALHQWASGPTRESPVRETQLVKMLNAELVGIDVLQTQLEQQVSRTQQQLAVYLSIESDVYSPPPQPGDTADQHMLYLTLRRGILGCQSQLQWLDEASRTLSTLKT